MSFAWANLLSAEIPIEELHARIGLTSLRTEFPNAPTGQTVTVLVAEGYDGSNGWAVRGGDELTGKEITYLFPGSDAFITSDHATFVSRYFAGTFSSSIPDVPRIISTNVPYYLDQHLNMLQSTAPMAPTWDVENHSWHWGTDFETIDIARRTDWYIDTYGVTVITGVGNGLDPLPGGLGSEYNSISVGVSDGDHSRGGTRVEVAGRTKPEIVAPNDWTSNARPIVASCAALLIDQANSDPTIFEARDPRVVKALLLAGATKTEFPNWSQSPDRPLDRIFGAGEVNIANSYRMLVAGRKSGEDIWHTGYGWDLVQGSSRRHYFEVPDGHVAELSAVVTWHREIAPTNSWQTLTPNLADLNLRLSMVDNDFLIGDLVEESRSANENIEHIYETVLPAGRYVFEVTGPIETPYAIAWRSDLTNVEPPSLDHQPRSQTVANGQEVSLLVGSAGTTAVSYQWRKNGIAINGATEALFTIPVFSANDAGSYDVIVSNEWGTETSLSAQLSTGAGNERRMTSLSSRTQVGTGDGITIAGFSITGTESHTLLIRGVGPALESWGVPETLPSPQLDVLEDGTVVATNAGWKTNDADRIRDEALRLGAFALPEDGRDSALIGTFAPGLYSIHLGGQSADTGVGLIEIYDASDSDTQNLVSLSTRAHVDRDANILIVGFAITGSSPATVLLRAVGPGLAGHGVSDPLAQPTMSVNLGSRLIASNTRWSTASNVGAIASTSDRVGAFPLEPGSADSALLLTLQPGIYTLHVSGADNGSGTALAEVYLVPVNE